MNATNIDQLIAFCKMAASGAAIGFVYDFSAFLLRGQEGERGFSDVFFWSVSGVITLFALFYATEMSLRLYLVFGVGVGWGLYFLILSPAVRFFLSPLKMFIGAACRAFKNLLRYTKKGASRALRIPKMLLKRYNRYIKYISPRYLYERAKEKEATDV